MSDLFNTEPGVAHVRYKQMHQALWKTHRENARESKRLKEQIRVRQIRWQKHFNKLLLIAIGFNVSVLIWLYLK